jgi:hypothetical protein
LNKAHKDANFKLSIKSNATTCGRKSRWGGGWNGGGGWNSQGLCLWAVVDLMVLFKMCDKNCTICFGSSYTQCNECLITPPNIFYRSKTTCS